MQQLVQNQQNQPVAGAQPRDKRGEFLKGHPCKVLMARGGVNSLFKNLQASLSNHISIKDG
jgi:hypothetical protein